MNNWRPYKLIFCYNIIIIIIKGYFVSILYLKLQHIAALVWNSNKRTTMSEVIE